MYFIDWLREQWKASISARRSYRSLCRGSKTFRSFSLSAHSCLTTSARCADRGSNTAGNLNGAFVSCNTISDISTKKRRDFRHTSPLKAKSLSSYLKGKPVLGSGSSDFRMLKVHRIMAILIQRERSANGMPGHTGDMSTCRHHDFCDEVATGLVFQSQKRSSRNPTSNCLCHRGSALAGTCRGSRIFPGRARLP